MRNSFSNIKHTTFLILEIHFLMLSAWAESTLGDIHWLAVRGLVTLSQPVSSSRLTLRRTPPVDLLWETKHKRRISGRDGLLRQDNLACLTTEDADMTTGTSAHYNYIGRINLRLTRHHGLRPYTYMTESLTFILLQHTNDGLWLRSFAWYR